MMKRQAVALLLGFVVVLVVSLGQVVKAGKAGSEQPHADGIFDNSSGYRITGDIPGQDGDYLFDHTIYAHGVDGVTNTIWMSNSGDYTQNLIRTSRKIHFDLSSPACGSQPLPPCPVTSQPLHTEGDFVNVQDVGRVTSVEPLGAAQFLTDLGSISFGNVPNVGSASTDGSSSIRVQYLGDQTWEVSTDGLNDIAVLSQQVKGKTVRSWYHLSFRMIVKQKP